MKTNSERRNFFKKAGISAFGAGLLSMIPFSLFSKSHNEVKNPGQHSSISIKINPMAVQREKRK